MMCEYERPSRFQKLIEGKKKEENKSLDHEMFLETNYLTSYTIHSLLV